MFYKFIILNKTTNEETVVESVNKLSAMNDAKALQIDGPVYPSPFDGAAQILSFSVQIVRKLTTLYAGDNDTLYKISRDASKLNALYSFFESDETVTDFESYAFDKLTTVCQDCQDMISEAMASTWDAVLESTKISDVIDNVYNSLNHYIYGEKRAYNDGGSYNNLIQLLNGEIVPDTTNAVEALRRALSGTFGGDDDRITSVVHDVLTSDKFSDDDRLAVLMRIEGYTYKETAEAVESMQSIRDVQKVMEKLQRRTSKAAKERFPSIMKTLYKVTTVKQDDGEEYRTLNRA